jgi:hypothetical protein
LQWQYSLTINFAVAKFMNNRFCLFTFRNKLFRCRIYEQIGDGLLVAKDAKYRIPELSCLKCSQTEE